MGIRRTFRFMRLALLACLAFAALASPVAAQDSASLIPLTTLPTEHILSGMPAYAQRWGLICEYAATSAATWYYGNQISEATFINNIGFDANPNKGFRGRLNGPWGGVSDYGIYPAPILDVLLHNGFAHSYAFRDDPVLLKYELAQDHPVVIWLVGTWGSTPRYENKSDGDTYFLVPYEHAVTAYGYDSAGVWVMDVGSGSKYKVTWETFMYAWEQLDGMALSVAV